MKHIVSKDISVLQTLNHIKWGKDAPLRNFVFQSATHEKKQLSLPVPIAFAFPV
jgi:hypothetical protein